MPMAYLNGAFLPLTDARIPVLDRGFLFADAVYEVTAVLDRKLVDNAAHLERLERSAAAIGLRIPADPDALTAIQHELIARDNLDEGLIYLQLTRGTMAERDFLDAPDAEPTLLLFTQPKRIAEAPAGRAGIRVCTVPDIRWARRDIKSTMLLAQVLAKQEARARGCQDAWMVEDGVVTEGASASVFIITADGALITRGASQTVLAGCTAAAVNALATEQGLTIERRAFTLAEALAAQEAFTTSASTFVLPVIAVDGQPIGSGVPGPLTLRLRELYIAAARASG